MEHYYKALKSIFDTNNKKSCVSENVVRKEIMVYAFRGVITVAAYDDNVSPLDIRTLTGYADKLLQSYSV